MVNKIISLVGMFLVFTLLISVPAMAAQYGGGVGSSFSGNYQIVGSSSNPQFTQPQFGLGSGINPKDYWSDFNQEDCRERQDMILMIPPGGCSPSVVRSDLLEEQNVPVFCRVSSIEVNPLVDISKIRSIRFTGDYPKGVQSVSYFPARAAVRSGEKLEASPVIDNVGYLVVVLKRNAVEANMPDFLEGNVTAVIDYTSEGIFGVGTQSFFLNQMDDNNWLRNYRDSGFWEGKGYLRASEISEDSAVISVYQGDASQKVASVNLKKGETSKSINLGGYYCAAGMKFKLKEVGFPQNKVKIRVDDQDMWVGEGSSFLDGKCKVSKIILDELSGGSVRFTCTGAGSFELRINPVKAHLKVGDGDSDGYDVFDPIPIAGDKKVYLAYAGKYRGARENYQVLIATDTGVDEFKGITSFIYSREGKWRNKDMLRKIISIGIWDYFKTRKEVSLAKGYRTLEEESEYYNYLIEELNDRYSKLKIEDIHILAGPGAEWKEYEISVSGEKSGSSNLDENKLLNEYYENSINTYTDLVELYPNERKLNNVENPDETYAAKGLKNAGDLSKLLRLDIDARGYYEQIVNNYPGTKLANSVENEIITYSSGISKESQALVQMGNEAHFISLFRIDRPDFNDLGAELLFTIKNKQLEENWEKDRLEMIEGTEIPINIIDIKDDSITIEYAPNFKYGDIVFNRLTRALIGKTAKWEKLTLELNKPAKLTENVIVKLSKTNLKKQVNVEIVPEVRGTRTEANFGFKIGIEKRAIQLSPERTQTMITNLQENIKKWSDVNDKLGKVVKGLKTACFATSAVLTVKNFFSGLGGASQARNELMTSENGWNQKCSNVVNSGVELCGKSSHSSVEDCLLSCNSQINSDVEKRTVELNARQDEFKEVYDMKSVGKTEDGVFTESYNSEDVKSEYKKKFDKFCNENDHNVDVLVRGESSETNVLNVACDDDNADLSVTEMRDIMTDYNSYNAGRGENSALGDMAEQRLSNTLHDVNFRVDWASREEKLKGTFPDATAIAVSLDPKKRLVQPMQIADADVKDEKGKKATSMFFLSVPDDGPTNLKGEHIQVGTVLDGGVQKIVYAKNKNGDDFLTDVRAYYINKELVKADPGLYKTEFKEKVKVKYYQRAPYQGLPSQVPFKFNNNHGWYVATDYVLSGSGQTYEDSGRAINYWICHAGDNGRIDFKKGEGDDCTYYNRRSPEKFKMSGLSNEQSSRLLSAAEKALGEAASSYDKVSKQSGSKSVRIGSEIYDVIMAESGESGRCSDFMSPKECNLMFNLCDPVICPSSRCDYGGQYRVDNVIQSGIIGSLALCLPNFPQVKIPVCLSGVHAGIDGYLSILNSTEACLQESLDTGKNIGICDEVKSIYLCEFFWKQAVPLLDVGIPRLFEAFRDQGVRGGGEYRTVESAWDNTQASIDYFKNEYAVNSIKAFNVRSTADVGGEVCKSFVGAKYPNSADFFDKLTEPDSPEQYSGWFDENVLNTATIPPTSHYKVYYHIYAGNDRGAQYVVYLKGSRDTGLIQTAGEYVVERGYIQKGGQVDQAKDFAAISGFTQLCINVNGKEDCNFKQVSTSAALNYVRDKYAAEQASESDITTSEECVAGKQSLLALAQPNLQAGAEELVDSELYKRGIVRVCSTNNPGAQVDETGKLDPTNSTRDRWKKVGTCDVDSIGCWLDTDTVKDVLSQNKYLANKTLTEVDTAYLGIDYLMTEKDSEDKLQNARKILEKIGTNEDLIDTPNLNSEGIKNAYASVLGNLDNVAEKGFNNRYSAEALLLKGRVYKKLTERIYKENVLGEPGFVKTDEGVLPGSEVLIDSVKVSWVYGRGSCTYLFQESGWSLFSSGFVSCVDVSEKPYLTGLRAMVDEHLEYYNTLVPRSDSYFEVNYDKGTRVYLHKLVDGRKIVAKDGDVIYNELLERLSKIKILDTELTKNKEIIIQLDNKETTCEYNEGWVCEGNDKEKLDNGLKGKNYESGVEFLVSELGWNDNIVIDGIVLKTWAFQSDKSVVKKVLDAVKKTDCDFAAEADLTKTKSGKYSDNKVFVDGLYEKGCLTLTEYIEINGEGRLNLQESMQYVRDVLLRKSLKGSEGDITPKSEEDAVEETTDTTPVIWIDLDDNEPFQGENRYHLYNNAEDTGYYLFKGTVGYQLRKDDTGSASYLSLDERGGTWRRILNYNNPLPDFLVGTDVEFDEGSNRFYFK